MKFQTLLLLTLTIILFSLSGFAQSENILQAPVIKNRIIKVDFFSPVTGNLSVGYEQILTNNITLEGNIGFIGVSFIDDNLNPKGLFIKGGPRLYFTPDYTMDGMKRYNDFQGMYFNPELIYTGFGFDYNYYSYLPGKQRGINNSIALMLNFGKQWVLAKVLTLDIYAGIGYGKSWIDMKDNPSNVYPGIDYSVLPYKYSHVEVPYTPLTLDAGFNIGILLK